MIWSTKSILSNQSIIAVTYAVSKTQMTMCLRLSSKVGTCKVAWLIFFLSHSYCVHSCKTLTYDLSYLSDDEASIPAFCLFVLVKSSYRMKTAVRDISYLSNFPHFFSDLWRLSLFLLCASIYGWHLEWYKWYKLSGGLSVTKTDSSLLSRRW